MARYDHGGGCPCGLERVCNCKHAELEKSVQKEVEDSRPFIGKKVWVFDNTHRVYQKDEKTGRSIGGPIWREYWRPQQILGETSRSWLVGPEWMEKQLDRAMKVAKKDWPGKNIAVSEEHIDRMAFVRDSYKLVDRIQQCFHYDTLKAIEAALDKYDRIPEDRKRDIPNGYYG